MNFVLKYSVKVQRPHGFMWVEADIFGTPTDLQRMLNSFIADGLRKETIKNVRVLQQPDLIPWEIAPDFIIPSPEAIPAPTAIPEMRTIPVTWDEGVAAPMLNKAWQFFNE